MSSIGFVYKIISSIGDKVYIGSTTQGLNKRYSNHKNKYKNPTKYTYTSFLLFDEYGIDTCSIHMIETVEFKEKDELFIRERYWIDNTDNCVNKSKPNYTKEEKDESKEKEKERKKKWYEENKDKEDFKQKRRDNSKRYSDNNLDKVREKSRIYGELHKEERSKKYKEWYEKNKAHKSAYMKAYQEKKRQLLI